ncbi:chitobiase/beta-hexosaminidase C-terminal domain-containing protein [Haloferula sp. BvORR071]|uniref:chitobiase/beta-hexosaminidase C-terminal domain-containing protein n=1 Tax=Haloferula sp. BvORR071 TaxID=1396141 RepID=UPI000695C511|nr:chitobiase/beta-hexosaminidase C-terminal domain-containing protein [Haloferula sp. BvORR071]
MRLKACLSLLTVLALPFTADAKPDRVVSFGANGSHWPELIPTPFMYDNTVANIVEVPCSWAAIKTAIQGVTAAQANSGTLILVAPGTLNGNGGSSGSDPVLESIGSATWGQRVTVAPRDGYGTVKFTNGVRFLKVFGVCFAGFESSGISAVKMQGCRRSALAWTKVTGHFGVYGTDGITTEGMELVEVVQPNHYVVSDDSADIYAGGGPITGWRFDGCYHAPRFFEVPYTGGKPHTDTFQFAAASGGSYGSMTLRDSAYFSSNNCAIQTGNVDGLDLEHCYVVSGEVSRSRYPWLPGGAAEATSNAFNGSGKNLTAKDCTFWGGMAINQTDSPTPWTSVTNTKTNKSYSSPASGAWTVVAGLNESNSGMPPLPTDSYLNDIWKNPGATTSVSRPVFIPAGGTFGSPQQVALTCSTSGATIYFTTDGSTPTTASTRYTGPFTVSATSTVKALATANSLDPSGVQVEDYRIVNLVSTPVISPAGGLFSTAQPATITSSTSGATIYYTLDGSTPTSASSAYTGPVLISSSATLKAIAIKSGAENSSVASALFGIGDSYIGSEAWTNVTFPVQTSQFTIRWNAIPDGANIDGVTGLGPASAAGYNDLACIARFATAGVIEARNGGAYAAVNVLRYEAGKLYSFEFNVNVATKKYSVTVTPDGGAPVVIAQDYAFRTQQASASSLNHLSLVTLAGGSHVVSGITLGTTPAPTAPTGLRVTANP